MGIFSFFAAGRVEKPIIYDAFPLPLDVMSRADIDENGYLEGVELKFAAEVYEPSIIAVAGLEGETEKYAKTIFYFIVINKRIPDELETIRHFYINSLRAERVDFTSLQEFYNIAFLALY